MAVVISGMHRSATSMLAEWAVRAGATLGDGPLFDVDAANPRGLYERRDVVAFNDAWLTDFGGAWWAPPHVPDTAWSGLDDHRLERDRTRLDLFTAGPGQVVKDPRLSLLLPVWDRLSLRRLPVVIAVRQPRAVAMSLHVRNGMSLRRGLSLWVAYNRALFKRLAEREALVLDVDRALANPVAAGEALCNFLQAAGVPMTDPRQVVADVEPRLLRQGAAPLPGYAEGLAAGLDEMAGELRALHGRTGKDLPNPVGVPDWAVETLAELSQTWSLQERARRAEEAVSGAAPPSVWRRLRSRLG